MWLAAAFIPCSFVGSFFFRFPSLMSIEEQTVPLSTYITTGLESAAGTFRLTPPDFYLFSSLWGGFGWLETVAPQWFLGAMTLVTAACAIGFLARMARSSPRERGAILSVFAGGVATLTAYLLAAHAVQHNLHGRYLTGWSLCLFGFAWLYPATAGVGASQTQKFPWLRTTSFLVLVGAVHIYCLTFILQRYF